MSDDASLIETPEDAAALPVEQWVVAADDRKYCLVDTYVGWPQRMWMSPGGMSHTGLEHIAYPLRLADLAEPEDACPHSWGTQECGHCKRCGRVVAEARPMPASEQELDQLRAVLRAVEGGGLDAA
jgi:hypothetical protein